MLVKVVLLIVLNEVKRVKLDQLLELQSKIGFVFRIYFSIQTFFFRQMQTVKLDKLIKLFDSPGIVMSKDTDPASLVLRNCVRVS